jgi:small subunit ribosomal protein S17e
VKKAAKTIIENHFARLSYDFDTNKKICEEVASIPSKRLRNKIAGFVTHLMKRIERGPVRGISLKLQEEERERRMDFVPETSALDLPVVNIDEDTQYLLKSLDFPNIDALGLKVVTPHVFQRRRFNNDDKKGGKKFEKKQ